MFDDTDEPGAGIPSSAPPSQPPSGAPPSSNSGSQPVSLPAGGDAGGSAPPTGSGVTQAAWDAMPKSWKREMEANWKGLDPAVRQYIYEREDQTYRGISNYRKGHESWSKAVKPFEALLQQNPDVDPVNLVQNLGQMHLVMATGTPQQKQAVLKSMMQHYGVTMEEAKQLSQVPPGQPQPTGQPQQPGQPFSPEQMQFLQQVLSPVLNQTQAQQRERAQGEVDAFFSDPKNDFAEEVGQDMLDLIQSGRATTLADAYELAIFRSPEVKAKYIAKLQAQTTTQGNPNPPTVKSSSVPAGPGKAATMDDTFKAVLAKHYG